MERFKWFYKNNIKKITYLPVRGLNRTLFTDVRADLLGVWLFIPIALFNDPRYFIAELPAIPNNILGFADDKFPTILLFRLEAGLSVNVLVEDGVSVTVLLGVPFKDENMGDCVGDPNIGDGLGVLLFLKVNGVLRTDFFGFGVLRFEAMTIGLPSTSPALTNFL